METIFPKPTPLKKWVGTLYGFLKKLTHGSNSSMRCLCWVKRLPALPCQLFDSTDSIMNSRLLTRHCSLRAPTYCILPHHQPSLLDLYLQTYHKLLNCRTNWLGKGRAPGNIVVLSQASY